MSIVNINYYSQYKAQRELYQGATPRQRALIDAANKLLAESKKRTKEEKQAYHKALQLERANSRILVIAANKKDYKAYIRKNNLDMNIYYCGVQLNSMYHMRFKSIVYADKWQLNKLIQSGKWNKENIELHFILQPPAATVIVN
jgi:hypothetical protein